MPTNDDRRKVAKELRYVASHSLNGYSFQRAVEGMAFGTLGDRTWRETLTRLADLIEPEERTCTFSECWDDDPLPMCSACGWEAEETDCVAVIGGPLFEYDGKFCKECGAKVVEK